MENLSSSLTFTYKFVLPTIWLTGFGAGTAAMFLHGDPMAWQFSVFWILVVFFSWRWSWDLKRVRLEGQTLRISNYRKEIDVPIRELDSVTQHRLINIRPITLRFKSETGFGKSILFMPPVSFRLFSEDELVIRLRQMAGMKNASSA